MMKEIEKGIENMFDASKETEISFEDLDELDCVHVIRCKYCKYRWHDGYCTKNKRYTGDDAFCSEGIR